MIRDIEKYNRKLARHGLVLPGMARLYALDDVLVAGHEDQYLDFCREIFDRLNIMGLILAPPAPPWDKILQWLLNDECERVYPDDCETKTFLHDIPVASSLDVEQVAAGLRERKGVIVRDHGIIAHGSVTLEQAFISYSSILHAMFVKYFVDLDQWVRAHAQPTENFRESVAERLSLMDIYCPRDHHNHALARGPFSDVDIYRALAECGQMTVESRLVDSFFGNISYTTEGVMYISQTASSMDELDGCIDPVPLDDSSSVGVTASSELPTHREIYERTGHAAILHGHPKFSVIMSMLCDEKDCHKTDCYRQCDRQRRILDVPIVVGEIGAGGISKTVPPAIVNHRGVIVYGHGVFTTSELDFNDAFHNLLQIELDCRRQYLQRQYSFLDQL